MNSKTLTGIVITLLALASAGQAAEPTKLPIRLTTPGKGRLSLGVYDDSGTLIRSLTYAGKVDGGKQTLEWDGTTDLGLPARPGTYAARGVWFERPPQVEYKMKVGLSGTPPYPTPDGLGGWGGNLGPPTSVAGNDQFVFAAFVCVESTWETGVQLMNPDGRIVRRFGTFFPWDARFACALEQNAAWLAIASLSNKRLVVARYDLDDPRGTIFADIPVIGGAEEGGRWKGRWSVDVQGLAAGPGRVYVSVTSNNKLVVLNKRDGKIVREVPVPSPRGVVAKGERVYAISGSRLLELEGQIIVDGLDDPSGLAVDARGNFYIAERGKTQRVRVVAPDGRTLRTIGIAGGRPREGHFNPAGMLDPRGLCIGPGNRLWVAEANEDFQRISVWDAERGGLVKEFFDMTLDHTGGMLNPDRTEMLSSKNYLSNSPGLTAYKVNLAAGTWYPSWHRNLPMSATHQDDVLLGHKHIQPQSAISFAGRHPYLDFTAGLVKADNGKTYAFGDDFSIWLFDPKSCETKLAALIYTHRVRRLPDGRFEGDYNQGPNNWLTWADLDGDGRMATDECTFNENVEPLKDVDRFHAWELQPDLSFVGMGHDWVVRRLRPRRVLDSGVPVYDWRDVETVVRLQRPNLLGGDGTKTIKWVAPQGVSASGTDWITFAEAATDMKLNLPGIDGEGWWASRNWRRTPMLYGPDGTPRWLKLGRRAPGRAKPGEMYHPWRLAGREDGFVFVPDTLQNVWAWTDKGLYLGPLYRDPSRMDRDSIHVELVGSYVYKVGGKLYSCVGDHGVNVHEIKMPKLVPIDAGAITVTPAMAAAAKPWDPDGPGPGLRPTLVAKLAGGRTFQIDGNEDDREWGGVDAQPILLDGGAIGSLKAAVDADNLYLFYTVNDPDGLRNAGTELPLCPFGTGGYVDFCIGPPGREVRVIVTRITNASGGAPSDYQMGYWPVKRGGGNPQVIASPVAQRRFDDISPVAGLKFGYRQHKGGYSVEIGAPWAALGITPGGKLPFDVSVAFANAGGTERERVAHWAGETEGKVVDRPGSAALLPSTWGTLVFDRSPLK